MIKQKNKVGRKPKYSKEIALEMIELFLSGVSASKIARDFGISHSQNVYYVIKKYLGKITPEQRLKRLRNSLESTDRIYEHDYNQD